MSDADTMSKVGLTWRAIAVIVGSSVVPAGTFAGWAVSNTYDRARIEQARDDAINRNVDHIATVTTQLSVLTASVQVLADRVSTHDARLAADEERLKAREEDEMALRSLLEQWRDTHARGGGR